MFGNALGRYDRVVACPDGPWPLMGRAAGAERERLARTIPREPLLQQPGCPTGRYTAGVAVSDGPTSVPGVASGSGAVTSTATICPAPGGKPKPKLET